MEKSKKKKFLNENSGEAQRSLKKGNINFDILEPEHPRPLIEGEARTKTPGSIKRKSKRGIFDSDIQRKPVNASQIVLWTFVLIFSISLLFYLVFIAESLLWMLSLPLILISFLWSIIMLVLFKVRPR